MFRHQTGVLAATLLMAVVRVDALPAQSAAERVATPDAAAPGAADLDALVAHALSSNPAIHAAAARVQAARARIGPAGALPDPMVGVGIDNLPLNGGDDAMTMRMVGVAQKLPFPGKRGLRVRAAEYELAAARARLDAAKLDVVRDVKQAYFELAFLDRALEILERSRRVLVSLVRVTEARYGVGVGGQPDVLTARVAASRLAEEAVALTERRRAALARLNAVLDRPSETPVAAPTIPERTRRAAVAEDRERIRFQSAALGARAADSPLPALAKLQDRAVRRSPELRALGARIAAQAARVELARKGHLPDFDLTLRYGQRPGRPDMISAGVSVAIPIHKGRKQDLHVEAAESELSALRAEYHARANTIRARVAQLRAELERERAQLALYAKSIIPQGRASLESTTSNFQVGRVEFRTLLDSQATLYDYETQYARGLTGFAAKLAELERVVGGEVLQ